MYLDNEVAKDKGATATKGVDISNVFSHDAAHVAALEDAAKQNVKHKAEKGSVLETSTISTDEGRKATQWASGQGGWDRLKQHNTLGSAAASVKNATRQEMANLIAEVMKKASI